MASALENTNGETTGRYYGGLVAFEGPNDIVSTQLRLLPPSSQVLILPDLEHYMKMEDESNFTVRSYVKGVHEAAQVRHEVALKFLSESSRGNKRLVFLNGGTAGAVSQCIAAISQHRTSGDSLHAEMILREVLREGVQGLVRSEKFCYDSAMPGAGSVGTRDEHPWEDEEIEEDPIIKAMKAADALYKETESLEPIECYIRTRPRSLSLPMPGWAEYVGQASPFFIFGSPPNEEAQPEPTVENEGHIEDSDNCLKRCTTRASTYSSEMVPMAYRTSTLMRRSDSARSVASKSHTRDHSAASNALFAPPMSPSEVEFGEARLVQMQASRKAAQSLRRTRSLDDTELHRTRMRRRVVPDVLPVPEITIPPMNPELKSPCRHLSIMEDPFSNNNLIRLSRAKFVRANTTTIRKSPTFPKPPFNTANRSCSDRDAKSEAEHSNEEIHSEGVCEPVLPFHEDLVIHFSGEVSSHILDSVIGSLQEGLYPVSTVPLGSDGTAETESCPSTPRTADLFDLDDFCGGLSPVAEVPSIDGSIDCDAYSMSGLSRRSNFRFRSPCPSLPPEIQPPTLAHTSSILGTDADMKRSRFQVISTIDRVNAIAIQNNLRSILDAQFPVDQDRRYRVSRFSLLPHMDKIWSPIFWNSGSKGRKSNERTADLILAIGSQDSVKAEFVSGLTGRIEKLGSKPTGMTRSGRLDLRFLVANAMQSFTTQSLANQLQENPVDSPHLLACLIVPHLASYLSVNASTRFLILEYPADHLATVVALQNLIGVDILKIAGIIDSEAASAYNTEPSSPVSAHFGSRLSVGSATSTSAAQLARSLDAISLPGSPFAPPLLSPFGAGPTLAQRRRLSFSKANYVLTNTATEAEIVNFISIIWKTLIQADPFYSLEHGSPMSARTTARYPTTKISNCSLGSSKFTPVSSGPSTPLNATPGAASSVANHHGGFHHWGLAGALSSPPSSRGSGFGTAEQQQQTTPMTPQSLARNTALASKLSAGDTPYTQPPPTTPVPPPPPSLSRDDSPSRTSFRSVPSRGRDFSSGTGNPKGLHDGQTAAIPVPIPVVPNPPVAASGGFSLRSKSLNRMLATRRGRKASGGGGVAVAAKHHHDNSSIAPPLLPCHLSPIEKDILHDYHHNHDSGETVGDLLIGGGDSKICGRMGEVDNKTKSDAYAESLFTDGGDAELYEFDEEERRLMPMYMRPSEIRKGNSRKALKWLGLA